MAAIDGVKNAGGSWFGVAHNKGSGHRANPVNDGVKHSATGAAWFDTGPAAFGSKSPSRRAAAAAIAKIPFPLASHIAHIFHPGNANA